MTDHPRFGFIPQDWSLHIPSVIIDPLPAHTQTVATVLNSDRVLRGWYYPPIMTEHDRQHGDVSLAASAFTLPATHELRATDDAGVDASRVVFLITTLGLAMGMRLGLDGWSHFYRAATRKGELVDFFCSRETAEQFIHTADQWFDSHSAETARAMLGAIHWYLFSQSYRHRFEVLATQCSVFDTCWTLFRMTSRSAPHKEPPRSERAVKLCQALGVPCPEWAHGEAPGSLAGLRKQLLLEGRLGDEPIGLGTSSPAVTPIQKEIVRLNCRLIVGLLEIPTDYVATRVDDTQLHDLNL
jgi:hypothetical protein